MEKAAMEWEQKILMNELTQGKDLAKQLRKHLNPSSSLETPQFLVDKILSTYEKALSMLNGGAIALNQPKSTVGRFESPRSFTNSTSPTSDVSDQDCKDQCNKDVYKKRKTQPRWTEQVRVCSGSGLEGPLADDGYSWRKYGQKDILGATFPRGYYRCTHRHSQGCLATKQVQRSDEDHSIFEVTYRGRHTCSQQSSHNSLMESPSLVNDSLEQTKNRYEEKPKPSNEIIVRNLGSEGLKVKTEDLASKENIFPFFSFPCSSLIGNESEGNDIFTESNYLLVSPCHMGNFGMGVQTPESELTEIVSAPNSVTNSPIGDLDISIDNVNHFDANFPFDNLELFA